MFDQKARIEDIYSRFKRDKSKRFILSGSVVIQAVDGHPDRRFGYATSLEEKSGKYVAIIGVSISNPVWEGWIIKKALIYETGQAPKKETEEQELALGKQMPLTDTSHQVQYRIECSEIREIIAVMEKLPIITVGGKVSLYSQEVSQMIAIQ